jgi:hypothetical protein
MTAGQTIVDIHVHLFNQIAVRNSDGPMSGLEYGRVRTGTGSLQFKPPYCKETVFPAKIIVEWIEL